MVRAWLGRLQLGSFYKHFGQNSVQFASMNQFSKNTTAWFKVSKKSEAVYWGGSAAGLSG